MSINYDPDLVETVSYTLNLRKPNAAALDAIAQALDSSPFGTEMVADLATGVGKTYIAGGLLDYLFDSGIRNVVIVVPGKTIRRKTIDNLTPGHRKFLRGLRCNPAVITLDDLEQGSVATALEDGDLMKVFILTVQSLLKPDTKDARRAHREHEALGVALYEYLQKAEDLVVIADEHHIYYSTSATKFQAAIDNLEPMALIGLTATPHQTSASKVVYRYPLAEAIADGFVKIPVLVARPDGIKDTLTQMADGVALLNAKTAAMDAYCRHTKQERVNPLFFIVTQTIDEASDIRDLLVGKDFLDGEDKVLLITSEEPDATLELLDNLEEPGSPVRAVVSVSMLKEGWDVANIYVIASVRAMESQLLTEQVLGRGLRLPFGARTGVPMLDTVEVLSHHSFADLLKDAKVLLEQTLGERAAEASAVADPVSGLGAAPQLAAEVGASGAVASPVGEVVITLPGRAPAVRPADPNQATLFGDGDGEGSDDSEPTHVGMGFSTISSRLQQADAVTKTLNTVHKPRSPGGVKIPLFLPRVSTRWERDSFSLTQVNTIDVEALGRSFAEDEGPTLTRKALDAERDPSGKVRVVITDESDEVYASQMRLPFDTIEQDLARRLMASNGVAATVTEMNAAAAVAAAFLLGAEVTAETPWRAEHGRLATTRLVEWISSQRASKPAREVKEVTQIRWPEPEDRVEVQPPADRQVVTSSRDFVRSYPYEGWVRAVYEVNSFDAYSTEFRLATLFEKTPGVKAWLRVNETVPLRVTYLQGAIQREYEPDFIVIDDTGTNWIVEGKSDAEMTNPIVLAKADAAKVWVNTVNASPIVHQKWGYILASESVIASAHSWNALKSAAQVFS